MIRNKLAYKYVSQRNFGSVYIQPKMIGGVDSPLINIRVTVETLNTFYGTSGT